VWKRPDPVFDREDVNTLLFGVLDVRRELERIRILLSEDDGEEEMDS
jgi:hypothetical protein